MERLTERNPNWINDETWERACEPDTEEMDAVYHKLKEYEDLEERGLLIRLPCKVGDDVWTIMCGMTGKHPALFRQEFTLSMFSHFGTAVFLTKEEAEAALAEMNKKENINE